VAPVVEVPAVAEAAPATEATPPAPIDPHAAKDVRVTGKSGRPYLHEIDMVRVITALSVVAVHTTAFTIGYNATHLGQDLQNGVVAVLHFTREVFLVISAFVLTYTYAKRPSFSTGRFWKKRGLGVLLPYIVFSFFYVGISTPLHPWGGWFQAAFWHTLRGDASYQLYYILLSVELYIFLPALLWILYKVERWPWRVLGVCFVVQLAMMYFNFHYISNGVYVRTGWGGWINKYGWRVLPFYEFYIVLGAFGALYLRQVHAWVRSHGRWILAGFLAGLALLWARYGWDVWVDHSSPAYANSVFQPVMVLFSLAVAVGLFWIGCRWAYARAPKKPRGAFIWGLLADAAFGIYLIHAYSLNLTLQHVGPNLPGWLPSPIRVFIVWFIAAGSAAAISSLALYIPGLARLVGRPARPTWLSDAGEALLGHLQGSKPTLATATAATPGVANGKAAKVDRPAAPKQSQAQAPRQSGD